MARGSLMVRRLCALVLLALWPVLTSASEPDVHTAGTYVDFGHGETAMVLVPFREDEISGIDLIERSSLPILTVGFGGLGTAVCTIEETGCKLSTCRRTLCQNGDRESPFWHYLQRSDSGQWVTSPLGASASAVQDGDIDAWVWTGKPPELPSLTLDDLRAKTGAPVGFEPAVYASGTPGGDSNAANRQWLIGGGMIVVAVAIGGVLLLLRTRRDAPR